MVRVESALRQLMRDTGKLLEPYGFHGSEPIWVRVGEEGVAAVGRTRTFRTWTGGQQVLSFGLALSATPMAWWEWRNWCHARQGLAAIALERATGPDLITDSGLSEDLTAMWSLRIATGHALPEDVDAVRAELPRRVHAYARRAIRLADSERYLDELLADPDPGVRAREAIVVLLADEGSSSRLDEAIDELRTCSASSEASEYAEHVIAYARSRAELVPAR
ncbi:hypothetical protein HLB23_16500 [Nocardia uniformis]|uniref:Uncharacterized protein n=1 Tax=Nocardia uniformis TaxID=53432 RepID=A0A849BY09_9NOCA|nr:hypothetical protein [Nocardia uniformis]NNH71443.1 hypothetical protein [Nocardia uniformis]